MPTPEDVLAEAEVRSLCLKERYYRESRQWQKLRRCYHPDGSKTFINISWFTGDADAFLEASIGMAKGGTVTSHMINVADIQINNDKAFAMLTGTINIRVEFDDVEYELVAFSRIPMRVEKVQINGRTTKEWRIVRIDCIYDRDYIVPTSPIGKDVSIQAAPDARPSYKFLDYVLTRRGFKIRRDLPGTDEEGRGAMDALIADYEGWLELEVPDGVDSEPPRKRRRS